MPSGMSRSFVDIAQAILAQPTAPFHEGAVRREILRLLESCPHVTVQTDAFGNLIALYQRGGVTPKLAFAAHMDHPGYVGDRFLGGVPEVYRAANPATQDFGAFAMWDLPAFELREGRIFSRACDDLIGCAAIVSMFHELERLEATAAVYGLFTRAEEVGFVGAIALAKARVLPESVVIVSLETSSERGGACRMGDGVIVRVGDRTSIFDSAATSWLSHWAREGQIPFQRCLMSGGTCEATAYQLYGYRTAALCVALGNYHNCGPEEKIDSEFVALADAEAMARLCTVAASAGELPDPAEALRTRLEHESEQYRAYF